MAYRIRHDHRYRPVKRSCWSELILWLIAVSALPLILIWNNRCVTPCSDNCEPQGNVFAAWRCRTGRYYGLGTDSFAGYPAEKVERATGVDLPSYGGVVANSICHQTGFRH